ncbi:hypothetical protein MK904_05085 [Loigolactobacillus coryniformis]|uniref:glycerophosphodiester phosphodiesterase family protein n=1 Tax=Loigolactobacillus coryniformis TaxID=1610 RepID=UPI00201AE664|nr:hypothetical protein [Loigolactobacillus coryniformis]MDC4185478.1 hypothetical protein [Loigolactobacillus coryniformis]
MLIILLLLNVSSYWVYHNSGGNTLLLLVWLLLGLIASYAWVERTQALTWWQLLGHSLRGSLWLPFSGLLAFNFWRYSWQPPSGLLDQFLNHRWQILPLILVLYLSIISFGVRHYFSKYLPHVTRWLGLLLLLAVSLLIVQWGSDQIGGTFSRYSVRLLWLVWLNGKYLLWLDLLLRLRQQPMTLDYRWFGVGLLLVIILAWPMSGQFFAKTATQPQIIAHRGVNGQGVQNTISALHSTVPAQPSLVEIDLRTTHDQQFIVSHDADTRRLTGQANNIAHTNLAHLQNLTLTENGQHAHYASFADYLQTAQKVKQPLLIELKASDHFQRMAREFVQQYHTKLPASAQFHSASLTLVNLLKQARFTPVGYILPFTQTGLPATHADFYSVDWRTLNPLIVAQARQQGKPLYVWTVDQVWALQAVRHLNTAVVITDQTSQVQQQLHQPAGYNGNLLLLLANF